MTYAADTQVPADRSRAEIERTLVRYGASAFMYGWADNRASVGFRLGVRHIRIDLPMPNPNEYRLTTHGRRRTESAAQAECDKAVRQRWRALALVVKAKLEAIEAGISTADDEFLAHTVLPGGATVSETLQPQITAAYASGSVAPLAIEAGR